ncbi:hypothetical protein, partial [Komagataeibacter rhaeticus]|uniref:hypothetical protein n=1 Tax=Komagataeibacter rhaeticus TaxID=215221 RepID=UPI0039E98A05
GVGRATRTGSGVSSGPYVMSCAPRRGACRVCHAGGMGVQGVARDHAMQFSQPSPDGKATRGDGA